MVSFFSFGGGRQSTALALLMIYEPEKLESVGLEIPHHVLFADTGAEPKAVMSHVDKMESMLVDAGYEFHRVYKDGENFVPIDENPSGVPFYSRVGRGDISMLKRQCTSNYKIEPVRKAIKNILGFEHGKRVSGVYPVWLGISTDESHRATENASDAKWLRKTYPLLKLNWSASDCSIYGLYRLGYHVPKSSCYFCPFKRPQKWMETKEQEPWEFERAVEFDRKIRRLETWGKQKHDLFIHSSGLPLEQAVIDQQSLFDVYGIGLDESCGGHCGL